MSAPASTGEMSWRMGLVLVAGLAGAAGVVLAALASHLRQSAMLETSAYFLMCHAVGVIALAALSLHTSRPGIWLAVGTMMLAGVVLFSGDLAFFALRRVHFFPMAAPTGGTLLISSWLAVSFVAAVELALPRRDVPPLFEQEPRSSGA